MSNNNIKTDSISTKFGRAKINQYGYWQISSSKEGNDGKLLHRLIYEDYHKCTVFPNAIIHHKDENKLNNNPKNLEIISKADHNRLHKTNNSVKHNSHKPHKHSKHNTGYYRVSKSVRKNGFSWRYVYPENGKQRSILNRDIKKLEEKVKSKGLPWFRL